MKLMDALKACLPLVNEDHSVYRAAVTFPNRDVIAVAFYDDLVDNVPSDLIIFTVSPEASNGTSMVGGKTIDRKRAESFQWRPVSTGATNKLQG